MQKVNTITTSNIAKWHKIEKLPRNEMGAILGRALQLLQARPIFPAGEKTSKARTKIECARDISVI